MSASLIKSLIPYLPRYAEEEGDFYSVARVELINALCLQGVDYAVAENTVNLIENMLNTLAVLNTDFLQNGQWCFISFPAQLLAMSILTAMSDNESRFFEHRFWNTQGISDARKEEQRGVLNYVENARNVCSEKAKPIRFIYVAWAIIKSDKGILFHQREDTKKRFDKTAGDYGLVGGRLNQCDIKGFVDDIKQGLTTLQSNNSELIKPALTETLKRELQEEAGLVFETHYNFKLWRCLKPYQQVQGAAPNHALTEYHFDIFHIDLTLSGYLFLQQQVQANNRLLWFSIADAVNGETGAYIKALLADYADNSALTADLLSLPNSFVSHYLFEKRDKYVVILLLNADKSLLAGVSGYEKPVDMILNVRQQQLLLALAAHNRGFDFSTVIEGVIFHPFAWVELLDAALQKEFIELAVLFKKTEFVIENQHDRFFRLSIHPSLLYFDDSLFSYAVNKSDLDGLKTKVPVSITRAVIVTALGDVASQTEDFSITLKLANGLHQLNQRDYLADNEEAKKKKECYRKTLHEDTRFLTLGLKSLVRDIAGMIQFCVGYQVD